MKFNNINVLVFFQLAAAKATNANGMYLRTTPAKGSSEVKAYGAGKDDARNGNGKHLKESGVNHTEDNIGYHADDARSSANLGVVTDTHVAGQGPTLSTSSSISASVVENLGGNPTEDNIGYHADVVSMKLSMDSNKDKSSIRDTSGPDFLRSVGSAEDAMHLTNVKRSSSTNEELIRNLSTHDIGQSRFHEIATLTGDSSLTDLSLGRRTDCNNDGTVLVTAGILVETNGSQDDIFKYVVKIYGDGSNDELDPSSVHTIIEDGAGSIFDTDAYAEISLSGDGKTLAIANTKINRGDDYTVAGNSTVKIFKFDASNNSWPTTATSTIYSSAATSISPDVAGGGGYRFGGLQVSLNDDGTKLALGLPYVDAESNGTTVPNAGNVQIYDLASASPSTPTFDLAETTNYSGAAIAEKAYIGRKVAISGDGNSVIFSAPGDKKVYLTQADSSSPLVPFSGEQEDSDMGSSLAITHDGNIFAYGSRNHDDLNAPDKGIVTVQKCINAGDKWQSSSWQRLGQVLKGERGEGSNGQGYYYVGDNFGYDIALSEKDAYNSNHESNMIRLLVGSPKNDAKLDDPSYYHGQGELFQINYNDATDQTEWEAVAYDIEGSTSGEKSGTSVAISEKGETIFIGAPGYEASSKGGYFEGIVRVYKQTEYSSAPSSVPSNTPSITSEPSTNPSVSVKPSSLPSLSLVPSTTPSISSQPSDVPSLSVVPSTNPSVSAQPSSKPSLSLVPSTTPSISSKPSDVPSLSVVPSTNPSVSVKPSSLPSLSLVPSTTPSLSLQPSVVPSLSVVPSSNPSAEVDKEFQLISTYGPFEEDPRDWCLTAFEDTSKLHMRPCRSYDSSEDQLWKFTAVGELTLARRAYREFCIKTTYRQLTLDKCTDDIDNSFINFAFEDGSITHTKNSKIWKVGFDPESRFERLRLYRDGSLNEVLDKWDIRYLFEFPSAAPTISAVPTESPSVTTMPSLSPSVSTVPSVSPSISAAPSVTTPPLQFSTLFRHACALFSTKVQCFGQNSYGERGLESSTTGDLLNYPNTLSVSSSSSTVEKVVTGYEFTCMLMREDGTVYCNGKNNLGQLGDGTTNFNSNPSPVQVKKDGNTLTGVTDLSEAYDHICAIYGTDDKIYCWGDNDYGQLGFNDTTGVKTVVATAFDTCLVKESNDSKVECKGSYFNNKTFDMDQTITKLTAGYFHVCALLGDQTAKCFGYNMFGQFGNGSTQYYSSFSYVMQDSSSTILEGITDINAGHQSTCLVANSKPMCIGYNVDYQLGIANGGANVLYPTELGVTFPDGVEVVSVHVNQYNGYAVMSNDSVYSWGSDQSYGLGQGDVAVDEDIIGDLDGESAVKVAFGEWGI